MSDRSATHVKTGSTSSTHEGKPIEITQSDLPLYCPPASAPAWSLHPRVFLDFDGKDAKCPYCGAEYELIL
jgi:uncharacterized Zn-finger protein